MVLRLDDTDVERNTEASVNSIFDGSALARPRLGRGIQAIRTPGSAPPDRRRHLSERARLPRLYARSHRRQRKIWRQSNLALQSRHARTCRAESDRRAAAGESFALRFRVPRGAGEQVRFNDAVYGEQIKVRRRHRRLRAPPLAMACPPTTSPPVRDDIDLRISHIIRGQDHLSNTYKHVLIFEGAGSASRRSSRIFRCWSRPMDRNSPSAGTGRWSALPLIATPDFCPKPSSISVLAGLVAKRRSRAHDAPGIDRRCFRWKASIAPMRS